ncbi:MAG: hypothetical protein WBG43_08250 [Marinifilaceae bacterium]
MDMDNISSGLIYVIIAVVIGLFKFLKKYLFDSEKPIQKNVSKNIFEEFFSEVNEKEIKDEIVETALEEESNAYEFAEPTKSINAETERKHEYNRIKQVKLDEFNLEDDSYDFDLKRAVISSEILNSKYC